ncbi:hypothetical protein K469DRAFT_707684 [Zopfia rhizophila CBS 207.26]|uniref:Uncharacterized protein n=1 Tax=Zopfia rhizophila CBS 207.26 TaxID=1314779 RepID=A0A6A6E6D3_9PEZI|nr:hypothetical protein K469DRAFT_707684 [Zopfia rhizophila CBS 207.26]
MAISDTSCRVAIYVKVTDIEGNPLSRHITLGQAFCSSMLSRDFRNQIHPDGYDACHIPPNFDSDKGVSVYFLFDIGVKGPLPEGDLSLIPHFVYLASRAQGNWNFIPRPRATEKVKQRAQKYPWGGTVEQEMFAEHCS